jgi:hypothetical protein
MQPTLTASRIVRSLVDLHSALPDSLIQPHANFISPGNIKDSELSIYNSIYQARQQVLATDGCGALTSDCGADVSENIG